MGASGCIGRVGGLAVALGVGVAILHRAWGGIGRRAIWWIAVAVARIDVGRLEPRRHRGVGDD